MSDIYTVEVRASEDCRLLGHVHVPVPPRELPSCWVFALRNSVDDTHIEKVILMVEPYCERGVQWNAFSVPAAQWEKIKDKVRA